MLKNEEFALYGTVLAGDETELELAKLARKRYLKLKMRQQLVHDIGDDPDTITDVLRVILLCYGVTAGIITDQAYIERINTYVRTMIDGYGGAGDMLDVIEFDKNMVVKHVVMGYFAAKNAIDAADNVDDINMIDLPGEPEQ